MMLFMAFSMLTAQTVVSGDLFDHIETTIDDLPGSSDGEYSDLSALNEGRWRSLIGEIVAGNYATAATEADAIGYQLLLYQDTGGPVAAEFYLLEKKPTANNYWGTYIFKPDACRPVVIQCPHPRADLNTGKEGIFAYRQIDTYGYFLSGTHRCNSTAAVSCSGTTSVCSSTSQAYRRSDVAHNTRSAFHIATEVINDALPDKVFIQLHGFSKRTTDPYVIMSNGSRDTPTDDYAAYIRDALIVEDPVLSFEIGHHNLSWSRLLGFTNTQGRYINSSADPCTQNATGGNGHFIHIEQERTRLRDDATGWTKMKNALEMAFTCLIEDTEDLEQEIATYDLTVEGRIVFRMAREGRYKLLAYNSLGQLLGAKWVRRGEEVRLPKAGGFGFFVLLDNGQRISAGKYFLR